MKKIINFATIFVLAPILLAWMNGLEPSRLAVKLEDSSYITIHGETNVNQFACNYVSLSARDTVQIELDRQGRKVYFNQAKLEINTTSFDCGNRMMNQDFQELLSAEQFPFIDIELLSVKISDSGHAIAQTSVTIRDEQKKFSVPVLYEILPEKQFYQGVLKINIRDFDIEPPRKMLGMVIVDEMILIEFHLVASLESA